MIGTQTSFRRPLMIVRAVPGAYVNGIWQPGSERMMSILATVQPARLTDYDLMQAEHGGQRLERMIRVYTSTELLIADPRSATRTTVQSGDVVLYGPPLARAPGRYRVVGQSIWAGGMTLDHFRYLATQELAP